MGRVQGNNTPISSSSNNNNSELVNESATNLRHRINYKSGLNISIRDVNESSSNSRMNYVSGFDRVTHSTQKHTSNSSTNDWDNYNSGTAEVKRLPKSSDRTFSVTESGVGINQNEPSNARGTF